MRVRPPGSVRRVSVFLAAGGPQDARKEDSRDHGDDEEWRVKVHCEGSLQVEYQNLTEFWNRRVFPCATRRLFAALSCFATRSALLAAAASHGISCSPRIMSCRVFYLSRWSMPAPRTGTWMPEHIKKKLLEEIGILEHELSHELPAEIKKAVAMGDLSENAEYHMAK